MAEKEWREHRKWAGSSRPNGRSTVRIECPYCQAVTEAYRWSLAGGGKKCRCGAVHGSIGMTRRA